jgi:hypothetical protein
MPAGSTLVGRLAAPLQNTRKADYLSLMNKLLKEAFERVEKLPEAEQELAAKFLLDFANPDASRYRLTPEQVAEVELAKREVREGGVASDRQMSEVWRRFGL